MNVINNTYDDFNDDFNNDCNDDCNDDLESSNIYCMSNFYGHYINVSTCDNLVHLDISGYKNDIQNLINLPKNLKYLNCCNNNIEKLIKLPISLKYLNCSYNKLIRLDIKKLINLEYLNCSNNQLEGNIYNIEKYTNLKYINVSNNYIEFICSKLPKNVSYFNCSFNCLTELPLLSIKLKTLVCNHNPILTLPKNIIYCTNLKKYNIYSRYKYINNLPYLCNKIIEIYYNKFIVAKYTFMDYKDNKLSLISYICKLKM